MRLDWHPSSLVGSNDLRIVIVTIFYLLAAQVGLWLVFPGIGKVEHPPVVIGAGPAGLMAALTLAEAMNPLAFVAVGLYGRYLQPQNGAPLRIVLPWKYGYKGPKSVVRMTLTSGVRQRFGTRYNLASTAFTET